MFEYHPVERPYPGLRPFEPWETEIFFGRDVHIDRLQDILKEQHFLTVTGPSGSGKSSLVRAGLLPALPLGAIGTGSEWRLVIMRPGDKPLTSLAKALCTKYALGEELESLSGSLETPPSSPVEAAIEAELRRGPLGLVDWVQDLRQHSKAPDFNLLILVDQFEEIFTYAEAGVHQADESDAFVNLLLAASKRHEARIFVVITMRTDFLGACTRFLDLPDAINRSLYLTPRLTREQLTQAIVGPARLFNMELPEVLAAEYVNAGNNDPDQLPVLQHALARRWDQSQVTASKKPDAQTAQPAEDIFQSVGNLGLALSDHADDIFNALTDEQKQDAQWLFRAITEQRAAEAGGQMVRRPQSLALIAAWSGRPWQAFLPVLKAFADPKVSFLTYNGQPGDPAAQENTVIDISHEAVIRQWQMLRDWVAREGNAAQAFSEWRQRAGRKEQDKGSYLTDADLSRAEIWLNRGLDFSDNSSETVSTVMAPNPVWASRYCQNEYAENTFATVAAFIKQSRDASRFLKRLLNMLAAFMVTACLAIGWFGFDSYQKSIASSAKSLWFPLQFNSGFNYSNGLTEVAEQEENIRLRFIEEISNDENIANRFLVDYSSLLRASIKSDLKLRDALIDQLRGDVREQKDWIVLSRTLALIALEANPEIDEILDVISKTKYSKELDFFGETLATETGKLSDTQAINVVAKYLEALQKATDPGQVQALGQGLVPVAGKLSDTEANTVVAKYVETIQKAYGDSNQPQALSQVLAALAAKFSDAHANRVVALYVEAIQKALRPFQINFLSEGLAAVAGKLSNAQENIVVAKYVEAIQKATSSYELRGLGEGLAALPVELSHAQSVSVVTQYLEAIQKATDPYQLQDLGQGLAAVTGKLSNVEANIVVAKYVEAIQKANGSFEPQTLSLGLAAVPGKFSEAQANTVVAKYVEAIQKATGADQLQALGQGLAAVIGKLSNVEVNSVVAKYLEGIQKANDPHQLQALGQGLGPVSGKLSDAQANKVVTKYVEAIQKATNPDQLRALSQGLAAVAGRISDAQANTVVTKYLDSFQKATENDELRDFTQVLETLAGKLSDDQTNSIVAKYLEAIQKTTGDDALVLGRHLKAVASELGDAQANAGVAKHLEAIQKATDPDQLQAISLSLAVVAGKLNANQAEHVSAKLLSELQHAPSGAKKAALAEGANALIAKITMTESQAKDWLKMCDIPFIDREAVAEAIRKQYSDAPAMNQGIWAFLKWANKRFGVDRPSPKDALLRSLALVGLPLGILFVGGWAQMKLSGRNLVTNKLNKLEHAKDRRGLGLRIKGYTINDVKTHWQVLGLDERIIEQRFLLMDLVFPLVYGAAFMFALLYATEALDNLISRPALIALVATMVFADWTENLIQLKQIKRFKQEQGFDLQPGWIKVSSLATQTKLLTCGVAIVLLIGLSIRLGIA